MKFLVAFALLFASSAHADPTDSCKLDAANFQPKFKAAVVSFLNANLPFAWNAATLKISCPDAAEGPIATCSVTFNAKDGTPFLVHDDVETNCTGNWHPRCDTTGSDDGISLFALGDQATDAEGNYTGPITCDLPESPVVVENTKTNNEVTPKTTDGVAELKWTVKAGK